MLQLAQAPLVQAHAWAHRARLAAQALQCAAPCLIPSAEPSENSALPLARPFQYLSRGSVFCHHGLEAGDQNLVEEQLTRQLPVRQLNVGRMVVCTC